MKEWFIKWGYAEGVFEKEIKKAFLNKTKKSKKNLKLYGPLDRWGSNASRLQSHFEEAVYF